MGRRNRQRVKLAVPVTEYPDGDGNVLRLRGALSAGSRREYGETLQGGLNREDARQRALELLFERLAVAWEIAGVQTTGSREILMRYRMATAAERDFVRGALRAHARENFPELEDAVIVPEGPDPDAFAALLCDWCLRVAPGERVLVSSTTLAEDYALALHGAILDRDAWPFVQLAPAGAQPSFYAHARDRHLSQPSPVELALTEGLDAFIRLQAPADTRELGGVDPALIARAATAATELRERMRTLRWCLSLVPTPALADQAQMALGPYAAFVTRALFLDRPDPAAAWRELSERQAALVDRLSRAREIHIEAEGTDVRLDVGNRIWVNSDGRRNMPSGEVFTGPHEASAQGRVRFTVPTGPPGITVSGVELDFRDGLVVAARADEGLEYLQATLGTDEGARRLGELGIGSNAGIDRPTGQILLDEKMAGTVHLALGRSYPETGGVNLSAVHWDLICDLRDGGRLSADGVAVIEGGAVVL